MARKRINKKVKHKVQQYITLLEQDHYPIDQVFIFGSYVAGQPRTDSDIDVAIVSKRWRGQLSDMRYLLHKVHQLESTDPIIEPHGFHPKDFVQTNPIAWAARYLGVRVK